MTWGTNLSVSAPSRTQLSIAITLVAIIIVSTAALGYIGAATHGNHGHLELDGLDGDGSAADPYVITNVPELQLMESEFAANYIHGNYLDANDAEEPEVLTLEFNDQEIPSVDQVVAIAAFESNQGGFIVIYDEDGEQLGQSSTLSAGPHENVAIAIDPDLPAGDHELTAAAYVGEGESYNVETNATITVPGEIHLPAFFNVGDLTSWVTIHEPGDVASISARVTNTGEEEGTQTVVVTLEGTVEHSEEVTLSAGDTHVVEVDLDTTGLDPNGPYQYMVASDDDSQTGVLDVVSMEEEGEMGDDEDDEDADTVPGFGLVVALLALIGAMLLARRLQN